MCPLLAEMLNRTDTEIKLLLLLLLLLLGTSTKTAAIFFSFSCLYNLCVSLLFCLKACEYEKALFLKLHEDWNDSYSKTSSTLHRFQTKTILFCSGYGYRPHYNAENDQRKRIVWKTHSRVERFENSTICKRCFPSLDGKKRCYLKTMTSPQQHHLVADHSTVSIQDSGQTFNPVETTFWLKEENKTL